MIVSESFSLPACKNTFGILPFRLLHFLLQWRSLLVDWNNPIKMTVFCFYILLCVFLCYQQSLLLFHVTDIYAIWIGKRGNVNWPGILLCNVHYIEPFLSSSCCQSISVLMSKNIKLLPWQTLLTHNHLCHCVLLRLLRKFKTNKATIFVTGHRLFPLLFQGVMKHAIQIIFFWNDEIALGQNVGIPHVKHDISLQGHTGWVRQRQISAAYSVKF